MNAAENHILDAVCCEKVVGFLGVVRDGVLFVYRDAGDLSRPGVSDLAFLGRTAAPHIRIIDRENTLKGWVGPAPSRAPALSDGEFDGRFGKGGRLGGFSLRRSLVVRGNTTRSMNDEGPFVAGGV